LLYFAELEIVNFLSQKDWSHDPDFFIREHICFHISLEPLIS